VKVLELVVHPLHVEPIWRDHVRPNIAEHSQLISKMSQQPGTREKKTKILNSFTSSRNLGLCKKRRQKGEKSLPKFRKDKKKEGDLRRKKRLFMD
jgi:hypothetical protein